MKLDIIIEVKTAGKGMYQKNIFSVLKFVVVVCEKWTEFGCVKKVMITDYVLLRILCFPCSFTCQNSLPSCLSIWPRYSSENLKRQNQNVVQISPRMKYWRGQDKS